MTSILSKIDSRYVYFFSDIESALEEALLFDDFSIFEYDNKGIYVVGESSALDMLRPHFYDWNGCLFPVRRGDSESMEKWRTDFRDKLTLVSASIELESVAA